MGRDFRSILSSRLQHSDLLGNHYKKNLRNIHDFLPLLESRLRESGTLSLFDFEVISPFCYEEMELIRQFSRGREEVLNLLGCYYSLQLLTMNLNLLEALERDRDAFPDRTALYKAMLLQSESAFSRLYSALIRSFVDVLSETEKALPELVICHVGARRDQDDIDVGIVHRPGGDLSALNRVIGRLNREMYRRATQMHFYLSEHSGSKWFSASIDDYERLMDLNLKNFVIITQLFGAVPVIGSMSLFEEFQERVIKRYTYREGLDNRYYEGFMRGVVEEIRSLVSHRTRAGEIVPKVDGLRMAKMIVSARRATLGIVGGQFWKAFATLQKQDTLLTEEYGFLEKAIAFMESVRFLYQLIFVQEEGILYSDPHCREALDRVALLMGYDAKKSRRPGTGLLRDYFRYSRKIKEISGIFKEEFKKYVEFIRVFRGLADRNLHQDLSLWEVNMATDYIGVMERFHHSLPWGEFISFLEEEEGYRRRFFRDLDLLEPGLLTETLDRYLGSMADDGETLVRFLLCFLRSPWRDRMHRLEETLIDVFRAGFQRSPGQRRDLIRLFLHEASLSRNFLRYAPSRLAVDFMIEVRKSKEKDKARLMEQLVSQGFLYHFGSPLLRRKIDRLVTRGLLREEEVPDTLRLHAVSRKAAQRIRSLPNYKARYEKLEDYYDLEFLRFLFRSIRRGRFPRADYMDSYVRRLARLSLQEAGLGRAARTCEGLGIYAAGGKARGEAFENDYDMFVLYDPDRVEGALLNRAVQRIHRELARLGNMPHHLIAEKIGSFAVSLEELEVHLDRRHPEDFIERSELLGSRLIFGGAALHRLFYERVIQQRIFRGKRRLVRSLAKEFREMHAVPDLSLGLNLKGRRGGLFDITLLLCMLKAFHEIYEARDGRSFQLLQKNDPRHREDYKALFQARNFLADVRGILKLTGCTEVLHKETDIRFAALLKGFSDPDLFVKKIEKQMEKVTAVSDRLIRDLS